MGDHDPNEDAEVMAEAARLHSEVRPTGVTWTFHFSDDGVVGP